LVKKYLADGGTSNALLKSYSCYSGKETPCGICKVCFRKWVALYNNDIEIPDDYYINEPSSADWLVKLPDELHAGTYRGKEDADWINALKKKKVWDSLLTKYYNYCNDE
jgi:hypothetical protein